MISDNGPSLRDLSEFYTLSDVLDHNEALDLKEEAERLANERAAEEMKNGRR